LRAGADQGALANLGHEVSRGTIATILKRAGIEPAPERTRRTTWLEFLRRHREVLVAADFFSVELWTISGLTRFAVLFVIDLSTRRVEIVGIHREPDSAWVVQRARQLTDPDDGCLRGKRFLLHDRDARFTAAFADTLSAAGVETVRLPARSPNLSAYAERFVRTIKESCLNQLILVGERSLRTAVHEFVQHYHHERNHQGMRNQLLFPLENAARRRSGVLSNPVRRIGEVLRPTGRVVQRRMPLTVQVLVCRKAMRRWLPADGREISGAAASKEATAS
jgi:transposase InsO family protein